MANEAGNIIDTLKGYFGGARRSVEQKVGGLTSLFSTLSKPREEKPLLNPMTAPTRVGKPTPTPRPTAQPTPTPVATSRPAMPTNLPQPTPSTGFIGRPAPQGIDALIDAAARENNVSPDLLRALLFQESSFNPSVIAGPQGNRDRGIAQINERANPQVSDTQALDPNFAIPFAARTIRGNVDAFGGDINRGVAAYNVGRGGASVKGPAPFGGGPSGQKYIDSVSKHLTPEMIKALGMKPSQSFLEYYTGE